MTRRPYYGWLIVGIAAAGMVATLPARTVGLGLITEPLLAELELTRTHYARVSMVATLLGSLCALLAGPLTDRSGIRVMLSATLLVLGGLVMAMSQWVTAATLLLFLVLIRGVGQSALSTVSVTSAGLLGNLLAAWAARRFPLPRVMALSLFALAAVLALYPTLQAPWQVVGHASVFGFCGGVFSVLFFTGFGQAFGRAHLGKIQACAQSMVVVASALGPWLLAGVQEKTGSYFSVTLGFAPVFAVGALLAWCTKLPMRR